MFTRVGAENQTAKLMMCTFGRIHFNINFIFPFGLIAIRQTERSVGEEEQRGLRDEGQRGLRREGQKRA